MVLSKEKTIFSPGISEPKFITSLKICLETAPGYINMSVVHDVAF